MYQAEFLRKRRQKILNRFYRLRNRKRWCFFRRSLVIGLLVMIIIHQPVFYGWSSCEKDESDGSTTVLTSFLNPLSVRGFSIDSNGYFIPWIIPGGGGLERINYIEYKRHPLFEHGYLSIRFKSDGIYRVGWVSQKCWDTLQQVDFAINRDEKIHPPEKASLFHRVEAKSVWDLIF